MQSTLMTCILQTVFDIRLIFCSNLYKNHQRYIWLRHKIIWNYFWSEFFLIYHYIKQMQSIYMNLHAIFNVAIWYGCLWYSLNIVYWIPVLEFSFWVWFLCCHIDFRPCFFVICSLPFWWKKTVEYMYLFNS